MLETIKKEFSAKVALALFAGFTTWWIVLQFMHVPHDSLENQWWGGTYGLMALWGGIWGLIVARKWGGFHSLMGKSVLFFSLGLLFQEVGQVLYAYYISFLKIEIPYPSVGDIFFYGTIPLYILAVIYLAQAAGVRISLRSFKNKLQAILIPLVLLVISYFFFLQSYEVDWSHPLTVILDFGVPLGQAVYISLAILTYTLTRGILGGVMKAKVLFILFALVAQFAADWTFLYQASLDSWYTGGINDYMYFVSYSLMAFALIQLNSILKKL